MKLKNTAFISNIYTNGSATADWGMDVGQGKNHYFLEKGIKEILTAMVYYKVNDIDNIRVSLGKGSGKKDPLPYADYREFEFVLTALFPKVYLDGHLLKSQKMILFLTKDLRRENGKGGENTQFERRQLKFSKNLTYKNKTINSDCIDAIANVYGKNSSWAILKMDIRNEDELHLFGIKVSDKEKKYKDKNSRNKDFERIWKVQHPNEPLEMVCDNDGDKINFPTQIIYYGVPGCGKSYEVNKVINAELDKYGVTDKEYHKVRCVFHPEYSNADFVGQIYPYVKPNNEGVEYRFKPGPFAEIVRRAYHNPNEPYFLIIEEINRGNAAAIFGEMFQLLDRIEPGDDPDKSTENTYNKGWSSYGVDNIDVNAYIRQNKTDAADIITYAESVTYDNQVSFTLNTAIRLPPNLSVYATMNTSDQNVFTMDNAFQRRFKSKMIRNSLDDTAQSDLKIGDTGVRWGDFRDWINVKILAPETGLNKAEDKCLGGWFIKGEKKTDQDGKALNECKDFPKDEFAEKVLKYLWNDVFKRSAAEKVFLKDKVTSLTNLIEQFESGEKFAAFENVFVITEADKALLLHQKNNP